MIDLVPGRLMADPNLHSLLFWLVGSFLAYFLASNALWLARGTKPTRAWYTPLLLHLGRFVYFLGIPYLVLGGWPRQPYQGLLSPSSLGLVGYSDAWPLNRWLQAAGTGFGLGFLAFLLLLLAWSNANRTGIQARLGFAPRSPWLLLVDGLYLQVHWAFYRASLAAISGDLYAGVFWGVALIWVEWASSPFWRRTWRQEDRAGNVWLRVGLSLVTAILFLLTHNLWVCLLVHWLLALAFWLVAGRRRSPDLDPLPLI